MGNAEDFLCLNVFVCDDSYYCRHEYGNDSLHCVKDTDFRSEADVHEVASHRSKVGSPDGILEEVHDYQPSADSVILHFVLVC